jgi:hypothetical protein
LGDFSGAKGHLSSGITSCQSQAITGKPVQGFQTFAKYSAVWRGSDGVETRYTCASELGKEPEPDFNSNIGVVFVFRIDDTNP